MSRVELASELVDDFDRTFAPLEAHDVQAIPARIQEIAQALDVLETNPLIGRPATRGMCELVIGRRSRGYAALYRYVPEIDMVFVLALRSRIEAGYKHD